MTFTITFNEIEAILTFHDNNWEIVLQSKKNYSKTKGVIEDGPKSYCISLNHIEVFFEYEVSSAFIFVIKDGQDVLKYKGTLSRKAVSDVSDVSEEKSDQNHKEIIKELLKQVRDSKGKQEKAAAAIHVFNYMRFNALKYVQKHPDFEKIAIQKAYEIKSEGPDIPELVESVHNLLNALGAPLDEPLVEPLVEPLKPLIPLAAPLVASLVEPLVEDNRLSLMATLLKKENIPFNRKVMDLYYKWDAPKKVNRYQRMCLFIEANKHTLMELSESIVEHDPRKALMQSIFQKKNIEFKDEYLDMYYKWDAPKVNRYKKICAFIEANGF